MNFRIERLGLVAAALLAASVSAGTAQDTEKALARLVTADGSPAGTVEITASPNGVLIEVLLTGLTPGEHAIHLHETGACSPDFSAAGDHFAPHGNEHGFLTEDGPHAGDLPNVTVEVGGAGSAQFFNERVTLTGQEAALLDDDGTAVIVHAHPDTYSDESGSGDRVACGVLEPFI